MVMPPTASHAATQAGGQAPARQRQIVAVISQPSGIPHSCQSPVIVLNVAATKNATYTPPATRAKQSRPARTPPSASAVRDCSQNLCRQSRFLRNWVVSLFAQTGRLPNWEQFKRLLGAPAWKSDHVSFCSVSPADRIFLKKPDTKSDGDCASRPAVFTVDCHGGRWKPSCGVTTPHHRHRSVFAGARLT